MATVPSEVTFTSGAVLTAAQLNSNVRDAINFIIAPPLAVLSQSATQNVSNATYAPALLDTEAIDRDGGHSNITNTSRYTSQTAGWYVSNGTLSWAFNATGLRIITWSVNGSIKVYGATQVPTVTSGGSGTIISGDTTVYLNVGDYLEIQGYQTSGGALAMTGYMGTLWSSS